MYIHIYTLIIYIYNMYIYIYIDHLYIYNMYIYIYMYLEIISTSMMIYHDSHASHQDSEICHDPTADLPRLNAVTSSSHGARPKDRWCLGNRARAMATRWLGPHLGSVHQQRTLGNSWEFRILWHFILLVRFTQGMREWSQSSLVIIIPATPFLSIPY